MNKSYLNLKRKYKNKRSGINIGRELIAPCLAGEPKLYRRGTAYFSSSSLKSYASVIEKLIKKEVQFQILCSPVVQDKKLIEILDSNSTKEKKQAVLLKLSEDILLDAAGFEENPENVHYRSKVLSYMIASGQLEIKFAIPKALEKVITEVDHEDLYHVKNGYFIFNDGVEVAFDGSFNESEGGHSKNYERTLVFRSYEDGDLERLEDTKEEIDEEWEEESDDLNIYPLGDEILEKIKKIAAKFPPPDKPGPAYKPDPDPPFELRKHQNEALKSWRNSDYKGILALATGSGKTITAIHAAVKISESLADEQKSLCVVIAVPYVVLADQWVDVLSKYNITPIKCYGSVKNWYGELSNEVHSFNLPNKKLLVMVVVNATLKRSNFQELLNTIKINNNKQIFMISDECHHHAIKSLVETKLPKAQYIMGLSATPWSKEDQESQAILKSYYGDIVAEYTLDDALNDGILCPYSYHIHEVSMNHPEEEIYMKLTNQISAMYAKKMDQGLSAEERKMLEFLLFKRARHLDAIEDKFETLGKILATKKPAPYKLFYCGSGFQVDEEEENITEEERLKTIDKITMILRDNGWKISKFTSDESHTTRIRVLQDFTNTKIDAIAAIKVLDEGFDIPMCNEAYITASSSNERQWVQRRGRILRTAEDKDSAIVHDFVITKTSEPKSFQSLVAKEIDRMKAFSRSCSNKSQTKPIIDKIKEEYNIE